MQSKVFAARYWKISPLLCPRAILCTLSGIVKTRLFVPSPVLTLIGVGVVKQGGAMRLLWMWQT